MALSRNPYEDPSIRWEVRVSAIEDFWHVQLIRYGIELKNWKMAIPFWKRWPIWFVSIYRLEWPKNERQLQRAVKWAKTATYYKNKQIDIEHKNKERLEHGDLSWAK